MKKRQVDEVNYKDLEGANNLATYGNGKISIISLDHILVDVVDDLIDEVKTCTS